MDSSEAGAGRVLGLQSFRRISLLWQMSEDSANVSS